MRARSSAVAGAVALVVGLSAGSPVHAAPRPTGFVAVASASGGRLTLTVPDFAVVEDVIDGGGPVAQAVLDTGTATSFASLPYPGDNAIAFPGLFNAATGQDLPAGYPFYVRASHPTVPEQQLSDPSGSYDLAARAAGGGATGTARLGREPARGLGGVPPTMAAGAAWESGRSQAGASATEDGDTVTVTAETIDEALSLGGGALRVASVRSSAVTTWGANDAAPSTNTGLVVQGGSAGGYTFGFGPGGLVVASQGAPLPVGEGLAALNQALAPAGISLRFLAAEAVAGGATAGAFEITVRRSPPGQGVPGAVVRLRFGAALAAIVLGQSA
jgi:hypothetical protein